MRCMKGVIWGELWVGGGFPCLSISLPVCSPQVQPRHCPQDPAYLTLIPKPPPTYCCLPSTPLSAEILTRVQWRGTDQETPKRLKTIYACMHVYAHTLIICSAPAPCLCKELRL